MRRSLPLAVAFALFALAAPAQAQITGSTITSPGDPHFVLIDPDAPKVPTVSIAGTATGTGSVDIVCARGQVEYGDVFAANVPVAADGTFAVSDVPLKTQAGVRHPTSLESACRLLAWPAGTTPADPSAFSGPRLALSKIARQRIFDGGNAGTVFDAWVVASGVGFSTLSRPFGYLGINVASVLDPVTFRPAIDGIYNSGALDAFRPAPSFGLQVDGQPAYPPAVALTNVGATSTYAAPGAVGVKIDVTRFSAATGAMTVRETDPLVTCAGSCERFAPVPVVLERTTAYSRGAQVTQVVDRWRSTDGHPHRLDVSLLQSRCLGTNGYTCSAHVAHRLPGEATYATRVDGTTIGPVGAGAILSRDAGDAARGGAAVILGQRADSARFQRDTYNDAFVLDYRARTIPATGSLTMSHTYALTRSAGDIEALVAALTPRPAAPRPHSTTPAGPPALPVISQHGRVRVRRSGRTFLVRTRDWVQCPAGGAACVVSVRGTRLRSSRTTVAAAAAATARVAFRLNRRGVRALTRRGRVRVTVALSSRAGHGPPVTRVRRLTIQQP